MTRSQLAQLLLLLAATTAVEGCRSPRRSLRVGGDAATLKVTMQGLEASDQAKAAWVYELSGCVGALNGALGEANVVSFTAPGLKKDLEGCQFRVKIIQPLPGMEFLSASEPNVLYWAKDVSKVAANADGALTATAPLQRLYNAVPTTDATKSFTLKVPVTFPAPELGTPLTGALACTPPVANVGVYAAASEKTGELSFAVAINLETNFTCTEVLVSVNGVLHKYRGVFAGEGGKVKGVPAQTVATAPVELTLQKPADPGPVTTLPPAPTDVTVSTQDGKVCAPPKTYAPDTGCK